MIQILKYFPIILKEAYDWLISSGHGLVLDMPSRIIDCPAVKDKAANAQPECIALFCLLGDDSTAVILLILRYAAEPPLE